MDPKSALIWIFRLALLLLDLMSCSCGRDGRSGARRRASRESEEERLLDHLFRHYNPSARPVINSNKTVPVEIQFSLMHIQQLDVRSQILTATGLLILVWTDERLQWDPSDYNLNEVVVEAKQLWVPEFAVINGAEEIYGDYREFRAIITSEGEIHWEPGGVFKTMCEIDITYFPFDDQDCALIFGAWSYHTTKMNLTNPKDVVNLDSYEKNGEWQILETSAIRHEFAYGCCPNERFSNVQFRLHMRRRYTFYVMNVILPSMVTSVLLLSIFYCPPGQKVQIGVVVLLSFRIFLLNVTDTIPKTSDHIPLLGIYLTCTMAITTLSMVLTVLVLNLNAISERPVPYWVRLIVLEYMARLFCRCGATNASGSRCGRARGVTGNVTSGSGQLTASYHSQSSLRPTPPYGTTINNRMREDPDEEVPIIALNGNVTSAQETSFAFHNNRHSHSHRAEIGGASKTRPRTLISRTVAEQRDTMDFSKDWQQLAEVVDRLFFWSFLFAIIGISLLLFHPLTKQRSVGDTH